MESPPQSSKLLAYLKLCRLPNVFTALADIGMGACYVRGASPPNGSLIALLLASGMMYTAGMVLNDVYDIEIDRRERPQRPLPSGLIHLDWARKLGFGLLGLGVLFAAASPWLSGVSPTGIALWRSGVIGVLLAGAILGYDIVLKHTPIGPIAMGSCRFLNVLLGMSISIDASTNLAVFAGFSPAQFTVAGGIGVYIVGVTFFAKSEATTSQSFLLFASLLVVVAGMALLALFPRMARTATARHRATGLVACDHGHPRSVCHSSRDARDHEAAIANGSSGREALHRVADYARRRQIGRAHV